MSKHTPTQLKLSDLLASNTILPPGASEEEVLRVLQGIGLDVKPVRKYYNPFMSGGNQEKKEEVVVNCSQEVVNCNQTENVNSQQSGAISSPLSETKTAMSTIVFAAFGLVNQNSSLKPHENPICKLKEMCEKAKCTLPEYKYDARTEGHMTKWQCMVSVTDFGPEKKNVTVSETAGLKQQAKTKAAQCMLEFLSKFKPPQLQPPRNLPIVLSAGQTANTTELFAVKLKNVEREPESSLAKQFNQQQPVVCQQTVATPLKNVPTTSTFSNKLITFANGCKRKVQKNPSQLLHEFCKDTNRMEPVFGQLSKMMTGEFVYTVSVDHLSGIGVGKTINDSKEKASLDLMFKLKSENNLLKIMFK